MTQLGCKDVKLYLLAHLDDELDARTSLDVQNHLEHCAACAEEAKALARESVAIKKALGAETVRTEQLAARIQNALADAERGEAGRRSWWRGSLALAASVLLALGLYFALALPGALEASAFTARHHGCVHALKESLQHAPDVAAEKEALGELQRAGVSVQRLAAIEEAGWKFANAHKCRVGGREFLHVYFTRGDETASLFVPLNEKPVPGMSGVGGAMDAELVRPLGAGRAVVVVRNDEPGRVLLAMLQ